MAGSDTERAGKYPIVLSDALLGKASTETYTGVRYNHKPNASSTSGSSSMKLKPSTTGSNYDLAVSDNSDKYTYNGQRTSGDGQYVLIFDPEKLHFVLHQVDSTFDMNLVDTPWEHDPSTLRSQYDQLIPPTRSPTDTPEKKPAKVIKPASTTKAARAAPATKASKPAAAAKVDPKRKKSVQAKKKAPVPEPTPDEDSDDGLTVEYPDASAPAQTYTYQPTPTFHRNDSDEEVSDEDAEGEDDDVERNQDVDFLQLPSPTNNNAGGMSDDEELDLEAELEQALKEEGGADESSESEEE